MKKIFSLLILISVTAAAAAQKKEETAYFSLQQAIEYAWQHDVNVLNAELDEQIASAKVKETVGIGLPQVSASFDAKDYFALNYLFPGVFAGPGHDPKIFVGFPIETPTYAMSGGVQASQILFDGTYLVGLQATRTYKEFSRKNSARTRIETAVSVSKAYYNLLVNRERLNLVNANVVRLKKLRDDTQAMYNNGFVEKIDLDRVVLTYNNISVEQEKTERLIALSEYLLKYQIGMDVKSAIVTTDSLNPSLITNITVPAEKTDVTGRIEYSILQTQQRLNELDLKRYRSQYLPNLVAYGSLYTMAQRPQFDPFAADKRWYPTGFVGATFTLPVFSGLQKHYRVDQAQLSLRKTKNLIESAESALNLEVTSSRTALINAIATFNTQEKNVELANEVYRVSKLKYDQGVGSNLEVITAETALKEAQTNYYSSLYDALVAKVDLDKATGSIK